MSLNRWFKILFCALPLTGNAQFYDLGLLAGVNLPMSSTYSFALDNGYHVETTALNGELRTGFGVFLDHGINKKVYFNHSLVFRNYYPGYLISGSPDGTKAINHSIFSINYAPLIRLFNLNGLQLHLGPAIDFNIINDRAPDDFRDDELNELTQQLNKTYRRAVYYAAARLGYSAGILELSVKYIYSLNSYTNSLDYRGKTYGIPSNSAFLFFDINVKIFRKTK